MLVTIHTFIVEMMRTSYIMVPISLFIKTVLIFQVRVMFMMIMMMTTLKLLKLHLHLCDPRLVKGDILGQHSDLPENAIFPQEA